METLNINKLLNREESANKMKEMLTFFQANKHNLSTKKGIYIYGEAGSGKTTFVTNVDTITKHNMSDKNVMSLFHKRIKHLAIIMDEIDGMNNGDKGGINSLIKIVRPKKTKKQKVEEITYNPIICIGNYHIDKKIKELMKVCDVIELKPPTKIQMANIVNTIMPSLDEIVKSNVINFIQGDLRKLSTIYEIYKNKQNMLNNNIIQNIFLMKSYNDDTRNITKKIINSHHSIEDHTTIMNETDRTIVGLLWHENIIDVIGKNKKEESVPFYLKVLDNMCFADYIDRITFQKQIWQLNEMSSLIKTFKNNKIYHDYFKKKQKYNPLEVRFTKVLTKYSTEFNNSVFIQNLCQELGMDKNDLFALFLDLKSKYDDAQISALFENHEITKLDINRIYRYIDKFTKENAPDTDDLSSVSEFDE
jgi:hypothetical protein